jgi:NADPH:quinone reductase-like Zn-dependent oxidoreductase
LNRLDSYGISISLSKYKKMKSIQVNGGGLERLKIVEETCPEPKTGEIRVRWHATSLNFHDYLVAVGGIPVAADRVPMSDGAGEVVAVGAGVTAWRVGDKVMSMFFPDWTDGKPTVGKISAISGETVNGFISEESCVAATAVTAIPHGYTFAEAATLPCAALTAWRALSVVGRVQAGESVLVQGSGGMSVFALQLAKMAGARVFATTSSDEKAERLRAMGAETVVNYKTDARWGKTIYKLAGEGVQHVLDVGGGSTMTQSIDAAAVGASIVAIGILGNGRKGELTFPKLFFKHLTLSGIAVGSRTQQVDMLNAINANGLKPVIDRTFAFDELGEAFRYQATGQHFGKIVLTW